MAPLRIGMRILVAKSLIESASAGCDSCQVDGPRDQRSQPDWLAALQADRNATLERIGFDGGVFDRMPWTQTAYIQPQMHTYDRYFYDPDSGEYTVQRWLQDLKDRYGGIDAVLLWPTYTNIGIDDRNQFDYFRAMPGGLDGVKDITTQLKESGVRVLWPYNPWDTGTHREPVSDEETFASLIKQTGGDGFNGDTMGYVPKSFWDAALNVDYPLAFEAEGGGTDEALNWSTMGWGYWNYPKAPTVDRFKFITRGKFMTNVCDRWAKSKTDNLQSAWFNGDGYESWENVWGTWNGITPYDGEAIRRVATMLRYFGKAGFLQSPDWEPHAREVWRDGVYASKWPMPDMDATLWTIVNRGDTNLTGPNLAGIQDGMKYYDCYLGTELQAVHEPPAPAPCPPPPPAPQPEGYNIFLQMSSSKEHGGVPIDDAPISDVSNLECASQCDSLDECSCVTYSLSSRECTRLGACSPADFAESVGSTVYLKSQGYSRYSSKNCYSGHGGKDIDDDGHAPTGLSAEQCQAHCDDQAQCECATWSRGNGKCWTRMACDPSGMDNDGNFDVFFNEARRLPPAPAPTPGVPMAGPELHFPLEAHGYGCILQVGTPMGSLADFLATMSELTTESLFSYSDVWSYLPQNLVDIPTTPLVSSAPAGMVSIPGGEFNFVVNAVEIEGDDSHGVDVQYPWEEHPQREHSKVMDIAPFYIDKFPVTTANYSSYLKATGYAPADPYNWLKNWNGSLEPSAELAGVPVTYIGLDEARAYCAWAGARLPHSYEWQYAAQGTDERLYPWGSDSDQSRFPVKKHGNVFEGPEEVTAHAPAGDSVFGVSDLVGNVWQYTDEFQDDHTRSVILRGSSNYRPEGSRWYFPEALELNTHNKYFLMDARYERAGTVGFRCVVDAAPQNVIQTFI